MMRTSLNFLCFLPFYYLSLHHVTSAEGQSNVTFQSRNNRHVGGKSQSNIDSSFGNVIRQQSADSSLINLWQMIIGSVVDQRRRAKTQQRESRIPRSQSRIPIHVDSGLSIRLRRNSSLNEGVVEVKVRGRWGLICNDDQWDSTDVNVICQQLGFSNAENSLISGRGSRNMRASADDTFLMSQVACNGSESQIQDCPHNSGTVCSGRRQVRIRCALNSGCESGWISANGFCYKMMRSESTFDEADNGCHSSDAYLLKIETQQENNFISNLLAAESVEGRFWTSGHRSERDGQLGWRWLGSSHSLRFTKWFPGWQPGGDRSQPHNIENHSCIALSKTFIDLDRLSHDVNYFFWMTMPCNQRLPYVCKKVVERSDCYEGNGMNYFGRAFVTTRVSLCQKWTTSTRINPDTHPDTGLGDHNYCRNPDGDERPWCWVDAELGRFGYCALSSCATDAQSLLSTPPSVAVPVNKVRLRGGRNDHEGRVEIWYGGEWGNICDDQWGLQDADVVCRQLGYTGALRPSTLLEFNSGDGLNILLDEVECTGLENSLYDCSHGPWGEHDCRSFETAGVVCKPNRVCLEEKEVQCAGEQGQTCIPLSYVCDRERDCSDGSDETNCTHFQVALVDGSRPSEGRVEITINNITGTVCDDDWDDDDAAVICRMIGYNGGVAQAVSGGQFGRGRGPIWLDDVDCTGHEDDIQDCVHAQWGEHNCGHSEDAGVSCLSIGRTTVTTPSIAHSALSLDCGRRPIRQPMPKIVGGQYALYGAYPWQARILKKNLLGEFIHVCGGTVIAQLWIVSAAHCFEHSSKEYFRVHVGDHRTGFSDEHEKEFAIDRLFVHPRYSNIFEIFFGNAHYDHDIALVKIRSTNSHPHIEFNNHVQPACLPTSATEYRPGLLCEVSGWGISRHRSPVMLMSAMIPIVEPAACQRIYRQKLSSKMFCAGHRDGRADTCQGDSGGPFVCQINGSYTIMGVTSWGLDCGRPNSPGVYTKVGVLSDWIQQIIRVHS